MADFWLDIVLKLNDSITEEIRSGRIKSGDQVFEALRSEVLGLISMAIDKNRDLMVEVA